VAVDNDEILQNVQFSIGLRKDRELIIFPSWMNVMYKTGLPTVKPWRPSTLFRLIGYL